MGRFVKGIPQKDKPSNFSCPNCKTELQVDYSIELSDTMSDDIITNITEQDIQECIWFDGISLAEAPTKEK